MSSPAVSYDKAPVSFMQIESHICLDNFTLLQSCEEKVYGEWGNVESKSLLMNFGNLTTEG